MMGSRNQLLVTVVERVGPESVNYTCSSCHNYTSVPAGDNRIGVLIRQFTPVTEPVFVLLVPVEAPHPMHSQWVQNFRNTFYLQSSQRGVIGHLKVQFLYTNSTYNNDFVFDTLKIQELVFETI